MSGHSKWSTIKRKKGAADAKRGKIFTKLIREIATAARLGGGEIGANPRLRLSVEKARAANMPKDNIERAIKKGLGAEEGEAYEEAIYEGYGPGGTAIYLEVLTDNKNRTVGEVRHVLTKYGGNLGATGCVAYLFEKRGLLAFDAEGLDTDALLMAALEAGADDVDEAEDSLEVVTAATDFEAVKAALEAAGYGAVEAGISMRPIATVKLEGKEAERMLAVLEVLEDLDDVQAVYANFDIADEELQNLAP
ncbi:MAG: YebC/PmpR family DNA-binding transcriptional regulator [Myxococcales bacterium]|nr:YebC/PmpR family DNA-binding transcriptional regulator [Myxococcales bacterium]